eukprot:1734534-Rhodomonas_salina.1
MRAAEAAERTLRGSSFLRSLRRIVEFQRFLMALSVLVRERETRKRVSRRLRPFVEVARGGGACG